MPYLVIKISLPVAAQIFKHDELINRVSARKVRFITDMSSKSFAEVRLDHANLALSMSVELGKLLDGQPFYGPVRANKSAEPEKIGNRSWSLWAGYCLFDFSKVRDLPLNFLYDFSRGLDTGGRNWECLYKHYNHPRPVFADSRKVPLTDTRTGIAHQVRIVDRSWLHFRGASYRREVQEQLDMFERMANALAETGPETKSF